MANLDNFSNNSTSARLQMIHTYVTLQNQLISEAVSKLTPGATAYDFEKSLAATTTIQGITWHAMAHGLGVAFTNPQTKAVVDAHVGFIDSPNIFDAWRLVQYCESQLGTREDVNSWQNTLENLVRDGTIKPHTKYERHYILI